MCHASAESSWEVVLTNYDMCHVSDHSSRYFYGTSQGSVLGPVIFNIFFCVTYFISLNASQLPVTLMIPHLIVLTK